MTESITYSVTVPPEPRGDYSYTTPVAARVVPRKRQPTERELLAQLVAQVAELNDRVAHLEAHSTIMMARDAEGVANGA